MEKKSIALACRMDSERAIKLTKRIFEFLVKKGELVYLETRIAPKIFPHNGMDLNAMTSRDILFVLSVGGDGTLLRVANGLSQKDPPPIFGINIGSIGFLDESNERTIFKDLLKVLNGEYIIESCSKIVPYIVKENEEIDCEEKGRVCPFSRKPERQEQENSLSCSKRRLHRLDSCKCKRQQESERS